MTILSDNDNRNKLCTHDLVCDLAVITSVWKIIGTLFPIRFHVRPAKTHTSLRVCLHPARTDQHVCLFMPSEDSDQPARPPEDALAPQSFLGV